MEIHELNTFSGTPGSGDYLATDNGNDTTKIPITDIIGPLNTRIDNIIAGPSSSAQEVIDARLGGNGVTYASLGQAIRGQYDELNTEIEAISEKSANLLQLLDTTKTVNSVVITSDADNNVLFSGTASANGGRLNAFTDDFVLSAGTYTLGQVVTDEDSAPSLTRCPAVLQKRASGSNVIATVSSPNVPVTFTLSEDTTCYLGFNLSGGYTYNDVKMAVMLNAGSTLKEYVSPQLSAVDRIYRKTMYSECVPYKAEDYIYGRISSEGDYQLAWIYALLDEFVPEEYISASPSSLFKILIARYQGGAFVDIDGGWKTGTYNFNHKKYQYRVIVAFSDERRIGDLTDIAAGLSFEQDSYIAISNEYLVQNTLDKSDRISDFNYNRLKVLMRNNYDVSFANARQPLHWKNPYDNAQNMHPKVLFIPDGISGHKFWMAYTPYDFGNVKHENPCIAYSDDGYSWTDIVNNPLDNTDNEGDSVYFSDTHLVYTGWRLECWYRKANGNTETIYRRRSSNGIAWTEPETIYTLTTNGNSLLSPAVIYNPSTSSYSIWVVNSNGGYHIDYYETTDANISEWELVRSINLTYAYNGASYNVWHIDVSLIDNKYVLVAMCKGTPWCVFIATSDDNISYTTPVILLYPNSADDWDSEMYRSCIVKTDNDYRVYYSARWKLIYGTGVTLSDELGTFIGTI